MGLLNIYLVTGAKVRVTLRDSLKEVNHKTVGSIF